MTSLQTRYPCPVCLGVTLAKVRIRLPAATRTSKSLELVLDHCARCGGVWFEHGEVQQLRRIDPQELWALIVRRSETHRMQCHNCHAYIERSQRNCSACGWRVKLDCPVCQRAMEQVQHDGINLDICRKCKGVWFDHEELESIWKLQVRSLVKDRRGALDDAGVGSLVLLDALTYDPFLAYYGIHAAGYAIGGAAEALSHAAPALANAPEAVGGLMEAAGEVASSVFEAIADIIGGLFN